MRIVRKKKKKTADIYKLMALALMSIALPVTFLLIQNQTNLRQEAAPISDTPSVESVTVYPYTKDPQTAIIGVDEELSITSFGYFDSARFYIHGSKPPSPLDNISEGYDRENIMPDTFYFLGESDATVKFQVPSNPGTYYFVANSVKDGKVCNWDDKVYSLNSQDTVQRSGRCENVGEKEFKVVEAPVLNRYYLSPGTVSRGDTFRISGLPGVSTRTGERLLYKVYLGSGELTGQEQVIQSYNPASVQENHIYYLGTEEGSDTQREFRAPTERGVYKVLVHVEVNGSVGCDWNDRLYKRNANNSLTYVGSCQNIGPKNLIVY